MLDSKLPSWKSMMSYGFCLYKSQQHISQGHKADGGSEQITSWLALKILIKGIF